MIYSRGFNKDSNGATFTSWEKVITNEDIKVREGSLNIGIIANRNSITSQVTRRFSTGNVRQVHSVINMGNNIQQGAFGIEINNLEPITFALAIWYCNGVGSGIALIDSGVKTQLWIKGGTYNEAGEFNATTFANKNIIVDMIYFV